MSIQVRQSVFQQFTTFINKSADQAEWIHALRVIWIGVRRLLIYVFKQLYIIFKGLNLSKKQQSILKVSVLGVAAVWMFGGSMSFKSPEELGPSSAEFVLPVLENENKTESFFSRMIAKDRYNEYAPADSRSLRKANVKKFIKDFGPLAQEEMKRTGVLASIKMAQALLESRHGTSRLAVQNNNHFGIKCFSKKCKKGHCTNHFDDHHKDFFRKFSTAQSSWKAHSDMLVRKDRYNKLFTYGNNYKSWAKGLQKAGYATDKRYAQKLIRVIETYDLHTLDNL